MRDPYDVLGVDRRAGEKDIKSAFRKLAKKYHPDQNRDDKRAKERFAEVNQAYEIVGDKEKRAKFDRGEIDAEGKEKFSFANGFGGGFGGAEGGSPFGGRAGGFRFSRRARGPASGTTADDILSELFGGGFGGTEGPTEADFAQSRARASAAKGADVEVDVPVSIEDIIEGGKVTATLPDGRKLAVKLPLGVVDGQTIRLRGQGEQGAAGARGDARVTIRVRSHPLYRTEGGNLRVALEVPLEDAVLGAKLPVQTPSGRVAVTVPPMTSSDRTFRLRGRGLPLDKTGKRGDLLVDVRVMLGEDGDGRLAALMRERRGD